jgi:hypothetical protein
MNKTAVQSVFAGMLTSLADATVTVSFNGTDAQGILANRIVAVALSPDGHDDPETQSVYVNADAFTDIKNGDLITLDGERMYIGELMLDPMRAVLRIACSKRRLVV